LTPGDLHLAANGGDETIIALAARLVPKLTMKFAMFMVNKSIYTFLSKLACTRKMKRL
jgi:hypothetical protein